MSPFEAPLPELFTSQGHVSLVWENIFRSYSICQIKVTCLDGLAKDSLELEISAGCTLIKVIKNWIFATGIALTFIAPSSGQRQEKAQKPDKEPFESVTHFNGADIPDFIAWQQFYRDADYVYRLGTGYYKNWVKSSVGIGAFLKDDPKFSEKLLRLLPDQGMLVTREGERLRNQMELTVTVRKLGVTSREEQHKRYLELTRQGVRLVQKAHEELYAAIMNSNTPQRESIWTRIVDHIHTNIKNSIGITGDNAPDDLDRWEVYLEFKEVKHK